MWGRRWWCGGGREGGHGWWKRWADCVACKEELMAWDVAEAAEVMGGRCFSVFAGRGKAACGVG